MTLASDIRAGTAYVELVTKDAKLLRGLQRAQRQLRAFGAGVTKIGAGTIGVTAAVGAALGVAVKSYAAQGDAVDKMSKRTGLAAETISELGFAAEQSGADVAALEKGVRTMQRTIYDAGRGLSTATDALSDLGLTVADLEGRSPEEQLNRIADGLASVDDPSRRAALAMQILGRAGTQLLPLLSGGAADMAELRGQARALGLTISKEAAEDAALLTDEMNMLRRVLRATTFTVGSALAPAFHKLVVRGTEAAAFASEWIGQHKELVVQGAKVAAVTTAVGAGLLVVGGGAALAGLAIGGVLTVISAAGTAVGVAGAALAAVLSPVGLVTTAAVALGTAVVYWSGAGGAAVRWLGGQFSSLVDRWRPVVDAIRASLVGGDLGAAAKVLWAGMKVEWLKGALELEGIWIGVKSQFLTVGTSMWSGLQIGNAALLRAIETAWARTIGFIGDRWDGMTSWIVKGIAGAILDDEEAAAIASLIDKGVRSRKAERRAATTAAEDEAKAQYESAVDKIKAGETADRTRIAEQGVKDTLEASERLREARAELDAAIAAASAGGVDQPEAGASGGIYGALQSMLDGLESALSRTGLSSQGTFSASAVADLANKRLDTLVEETKKVAANTAKIARNSSQGGLQFD